MAPINPANLLERLAQALDGAAPLALVPGADQVVIPDGADLVLGTSGSTAGRPQIVAIPRSSLHAAVSAAHQVLGGSGGWLLTLPADHVAGVMVAARSLVAGTPLTTASAGAFRTETFISDVDRFLLDGATRHYTSLVPTQLGRVLADPAATRAAAQLDTILVGGAATPSGMLALAHEAGLRVVTTYGMTETCGGCVYSGVPLPGVEVSVAPDSGRITLTGPQVALGYVVDGELSPFAGSFTTADRGSWESGTLRVLGRLDDVILSGGVNVDPRIVEETILGLESVAECLVVGLPDAEWGQRVAAAVVPRPGLDEAQRSELPERVAQIVRQRLGGAWTPRLVLALDELPLRGPGKPDRAAVASILARERD